MWKRRTRLKATLSTRRTVAYVRVSTEEQARDGVSLTAQQSRLTAFAEATGREISEIITDAGLSGKNTKRPGLQRMLKDVERGEIGCVMVYSLSRATRSTRDLSDLLDLFRKYGVDFVSVTEHLDTTTAMGRAMVAFTGVLAQLEREQIGERTADGLAQKRRERKAYGHAPFGWARRENSTDLVPIAKEQKALAHIRKMDVDGVSYRKIGAWLTENGFKPRQGAAIWHAASVRKMLLSRMFTEE